MKIKVQAQASHSKLLLAMQYNVVEVPFPIAIPFQCLTGTYTGVQHSEIPLSPVIMQRRDMNPETGQPAGLSRAVKEGNHSSLAVCLTSSDQLMDWATCCIKGLGDSNKEVNF